MTNEELAIRIKAGEADLTLQLWTQVEKFVAMKARQYVRRSNQSGYSLNDYDHEDLTQSGYFAVVVAAQRYDEATGYKYLTLLDWTLRNAFADALNIRSERQRRDPLHNTMSLDAPFSENEGISFYDTLASDDNVEETSVQAAYQQHLHETLEACLAAIPELHSRTLRERYYDNLTVAQIGEKRNCSRQAVEQAEQRGLRRLYEERGVNGLEAFLNEHIDYYRGTGLTQFRNTWSSSVENIVEKRERLASRWLKSHGHTIKGGR